MDRQLIERAADAAARTFGSTPIFLAYAYGSRIYGTPAADSDLDIGYYLDPDGERRDLPLFDQMAMEAELGDAIGVPVDLRNLGGAPLELRGRALEEGVRLYCSGECRRVAMETLLLSRYHDYKPALAAMHEERLQAFAGRK